MEPGVFCSGVSFRKELFTGVRMLFDGIYNGRRVLVTGHAGFKGAWLAAWLVRLGAKVCGISLRPHFEPNHFRLLSLPVQSEWCDIREPGELSTIVGEVRPEIVFHFASQSSPERAWEEPEFTYSVNVMGCVHLLDAVRRTPGCRAVAVALPGGGRSGPDPLAASGRCVAEVLASYRTGEEAVPVVGLRSGILVGGGDWNAGRLLPDLVPYAASRLESWLDPFADPLGAGHQTIQSLYAIGSGGATGLGLGNSRQKHLYVPEPQNDFIFSIICEELGFIGAAILILLFVALLLRGMVIAVKAPDKFGSLLAVGFVVQVVMQAALNMAVVTNTIPNTGISLPFFSSGGTSLMMLLGEMGILLSVSRQAGQERY